MAGDVIPIRDSGARSLESLHHSWNVERRRQLQNHVDVIAHDADLDNADAVPMCLIQQEFSQECGYRFVD